MVRLEISDECPEDLSNFLLDHFSLEKEDMFSVDGPVNLNRLAKVCEMAERPDLLYPPFAPGMPAELRTDESVFDVLKKRRYFFTIRTNRFRRSSTSFPGPAKDPDVLAIKQTLYRTGSDSAIVDHLVRAAQAGKEVTAIIELMARSTKRQTSRSPISCRRPART